MTTKINETEKRFKMSNSLPNPVIAHKIKIRYNIIDQNKKTSFLIKIPP